MYDYCTSDECCLEVVCDDDGDESVRSKAPECILKKSYSTASDVWAFGVLMYEVFTYGCRPYRNIPGDNDVAKHVSAVIFVLRLEKVTFQVIEQSVNLFGSY